MTTTTLEDRKAPHPFWLDGAYDFRDVEGCRAHPRHQWVTLRLGDVLRDSLKPDDHITICRMCYVPRCGQPTDEPDRCEYWRSHNLNGFLFHRSPISGTVEVVNVIRSLWASVQGDPVFMRRVNGWLTIFWLVMIPISIATGWINSVTYVAALSLWALVSGHWSAWQAARVEVEQQKQAEHDDAGDVVERIVRDTDLSADT